MKLKRNILRLITSCSAVYLISLVFCQPIDEPNTKDIPINILWTQWRSGSTFLGAVISQATPFTFYSYEPLHGFGVRIFKNITDKDADIAFDRFQDLINCDFEAEYFSNIFNLTFMVMRNPVTNYIKNKYKSDAGFLQKFCQEKADRLAIKVLRLSLSFADRVFQLKDNIKIVYMVRDPRATLRSRWQTTKFCDVTEKDCYDPETSCNNLITDYQFISPLLKKYPSRFRVVRYEDLSNDSLNYVKTILTFLGQPFSSMIKLFLKKENVHVDTEDHTYAWRKDLPYLKMVNIQNKCQQAMNLFGYRIYKSKYEYNNIDPLLQKKYNFL